MTLTCLILVTLLGEVGEEILAEYSVDHFNVESLILGGFLTQNSAGKIQYYHPSIERHFSTRLVKEHTQKQNSIYKEIFKTAQCLGWEQSKTIIHLQLAHLCDSVIPMTVVNAITEFKRYTNTPVTNRKHIAAYIIGKYALGKNKLVSLSNSLPVTELLCLYSSNGKQNIFTKYLLEEVEELYQFKPKTNEELQQQYWIFRQAASHSRLSDSLNSGIYIIDTAISLLKDLSEKFDRAIRARVEADLLDRKCVCLKSFNKLEEAKIAGLEAANLANSNALFDVECLSYIDLGYIYYGQNKDKEDLKKYWEKAVQIYTNNKQDISKHNQAMTLASELIYASLLIINNDEEKAIAVLDEMTFFANQQGNAYYEAQGLLIKAIALLRYSYTNEPTISIDTAEYLAAIVQSVEDLCIASNLDKFFSCCYYLKACIYERRKDTHAAATYFFKSIEKLTSKGTSKVINNVDCALIVNALEFLNKNKLPIPKATTEISQQLSSYKFKSKTKLSTLFGINGLELPCP